MLGARPVGSPIPGLRGFRGTPAWTSRRPLARRTSGPTTVARRHRDLVCADKYDTLAIQEVERRRGSRVNRQGLPKAEAYENHPQLRRLVQKGHLRPDLRKGDWTAPIRRTAMPWLRPLAPRKCPTSRTAAGSPAPRRARMIRRRAGRIGASSSPDRALDDCSSPRPWPASPSTRTLAGKV